jgi:transposase-like protein
MKLDDKIFTDKDAAREHLEAMQWPNGPICPHCGNCDETRITEMKGKAHRPGLYNCMECRSQFTVTVGTVFERSKIPLNKWLLATFLITSSKKGMSAHQLHRMLGVTYKTAWFMAHRIREAMKEDVSTSGPLGGEGKKAANPRMTRNPNPNAIAATDINPAASMYFSGNLGANCPE